MFRKTELWKIKKHLLWVVGILKNAPQILPQNEVLPKRDIRALVGAVHLKYDAYIRERKKNMKASASLIVEESRDMQVSTSFACGEAVKKQDCDVSEKTDHTPINKPAKKGFLQDYLENNWNVWQERMAVCQDVWSRATWARKRENFFGLHHPV